ncbi:N-acetylmuramoyl-L-alanine amidase [Balneolaceae bacterium ANBcel3]|nr:N-acetylmuramoyl-L-alanine amidase [Balneolaceae bacterium ANBcel3]
MNIEHHLLDKAVADIQKTSKTSGAFKEGLPDTLVLHYTASASASSAIKTFLDPDVAVSAHIVIDRDGSVTQLLPFNETGWHAGKSAWKDRTSLNQYSIGIELVNAGKLMKTGAVWRSWFGKEYPENEVMQAVHKNESSLSGWHIFTEEQIEATFQLCRSLLKEYPITYILGHDDISPGRKVDPGPAFPLDKLRDRLSKGGRKEDDEPEVYSSDKRYGTVDVRALNIRSGPGTSHSTITAPLSNGTRVSILSEDKEWMEVEVPIRGWVAKRFIKEGGE